MNKLLTIQTTTQNEQGELKQFLLKTCLIKLNHKRFYLKLALEILKKEFYSNQNY